MDRASREPCMGAVPPCCRSASWNSDPRSWHHPDLIGQHVGGKEADRPTLSSRDPDEAPDGLEGGQIYRADLLLKCVAA